MGSGTSLVFIAVGAILKWAVDIPNSHGFDLNAIGLIIFIVGIVGLIVSILFWGSWGGFGSYRRRRTVTRTYGEGGPPGQPYGGPGQPYSGPGQPYNGPHGTYIDEREQY